MCMGRGWLKKRSKRPISLDLDLAKRLVQQVAVEPDEQTAKDHHQQPSNDIGTRMDRLSETEISSFLERTRQRQRK